jgi:hypothetical protein
MAHAVESRLEFTDIAAQAVDLLVDPPHMRYDPFFRLVCHGKEIGYSFGRGEGLLLDIDCRSRLARWVSKNQNMGGRVTGAVS